jgi:hypothetical protein
MSFFCTLGFHGAFSKTRQNPLHSLIEKTPESAFLKKKEQGRLSLFFPLFSESNFVCSTKLAELTLPIIRMPYFPQNASDSRTVCRHFRNRHSIG